MKTLDTSLPAGIGPLEAVGFVGTKRFFFCYLYLLTYVEWHCQRSLMLMSALSCQTSTSDRYQGSVSSVPHL